MNKTYISIAIVAVVIVGGGFWLNSYNPKAESPETPLTSGPSVRGAINKDEIADVGMGIEQTTLPAPAKEFVVDGGNYFYKPTSLIVKKGDTVRIIFKNTGGFHDLKIDEFAVATKKLASGAEETIEFVADKAGSFEYYCSVGTHRQMGMKGTLIVQ